jgi:hypothetical protein
MGPGAARAEHAAQEVHHSAPLTLLARVGLLGRSLVWLLVGVLAVAVAFGDNQETDQQGALRAVAAGPYGEVLLWAVVAGFVGYAVWRAFAAAVGHHDEDDGRKRGLLRVVSAAQALFYAALAWNTVRFLQGNGGDADQETRSRAAELMSLPYGRWLVGGIGVILVVVGLSQAVFGVRREHDERLDVRRMPGWLRRPSSGLGLVGRLARGSVIALVGAFLVRAAWQFEPDQAKGLDAGLAAVAAQPYGPFLLLAAALGLITYGLWSLVEAVYRRL